MWRGGQGHREWSWQYFDAPGWQPAVPLRVQSWQKTDEREMKWQPSLGRPRIQGEAIQSVGFIGNAGSYTPRPKRSSKSVHAGLRNIGTSARDFDKVKLEEQRADWHGAGDLVVSCCWSCPAHLQNQWGESPKNKFQTQGKLSNITLFSWLVRL